ncbi:sensor domain-containing diguanylate cyclase [Paraliobacillus zengyii]|uniref:sensor domain-containing diguanylate cyclase n=1 Tax=Paraliobacillus zengyii TaxID=2213194 RepID=UPI000DD49BB3|nr:sensor domain-containing diguanylate cyclase [Paraliobacillus zengyii]
MDIEISSSILNSIKDQICLIDYSGNIIQTNDEWLNFAKKNNGNLSALGVGTNYMQVAKENTTVLNGLEAIMNGEVDEFTHEYPCHSPDFKRWFNMQATRMKKNEFGIEGIVIRHIDITKQKLMEIQLKKRVHTDSLTNLYNRRYFDKEFLIEMKRSNRNNSSLSVLYIDIDDFKHLNDTYGHTVGDLVLKEISLVFLETIRDSDTCARIGGDEFAIILPETSNEALDYIAKRIIININKIKIQEEITYPIKVDVSIGGASFSNDLDMRAMLDKVDRALYAAKDKGKNQIVIL